MFQKQNMCNNSRMNTMLINLDLWLKLYAALDKKIGDLLYFDQINSTTTKFQPAQTDL